MQETPTSIKFKLNLNILKTYSTKSCGPVINLRNIGLLDNKHQRNGHLTTSTVIHQEHLPRSIECASKAFLFREGRADRPISPAMARKGLGSRMMNFGNQDHVLKLQ